MSGLFAGTPLERPVTCEVCGKPVAECRCPRDADGNVLLARDQSPRVRRERRRGKWVTVVTGLDASASDVAGMAKELRGMLGAGGSVTGEKTAPAIEVQGDHRDRIVQWLKDKGYAAKAAGG